MKCKRLCAWLLCLVMMFSLLPVSAAAKWYEKHSVTVEYVFNDDSSKSKSADVKTTYHTEGAITPFSVKEAGYNHSAKVTSGKADCSIDDLGFLHVKHVDADSVITVTYTPKDNYIYIDKYFGNGGIFSKWDGENIKLNGYEFVKNNALPKKYVIENHKLAPAMEKYRFLTVTNADNSTTVYDFSYAVVIPKTSESTERKIKDVWYDRDAGEWYYSYENKSGLFDKIPLVNEGGVNFCYNKEHTEASEHHQFDQFVKKVPPTCTEQGYTVYQCAYCTKTEMREYTGPLNHDWKWKHVEGMEEAASKHQQVCQRSGCGEKDTPVKCNFEAVTTGTITTYTCKNCGYHYSKDSSLPTTPVYVYFKTVNTKNELVKVESGVTYNANGSSWATLGKLTTKQTVAVSTDKIEVGKLGAEVKDASDDPNTTFERYKVNENVINGNVGISLIDWESIVLEPNGAAGYESEAPYGKDAWHLNGKVNVYKLSYDANRPAGVTADVTVPDSAYYLPGWNAPVSIDDPTLQGYNFGGWYKEPKCVNEAKEKVAVAEDTVLYAKWTPLAQPTADLIDDDITIKHGVNGDPEHGNDTDTTAHIVEKNAKISYQATLDMQSLKFGTNPEHADTVSNIQRAMTFGGVTSLWDFIKNNSIGIFAGSKVNLHVKFDENLNVTKGSFDNIKLTSDWFQLDKTHPDYLSQEAGGYWKIPCVIKAEKGTNNSSIITLSGITLPLTADAQDTLNSNTALDIISEGYIDGTIKISTEFLNKIITYELSLIGMSKDAPAKNTAKLKLAVPTYTVTYDGNDADSGTMTDKNSPYAYGAAATVLTNGFTRSGYTFTGWNTSADGSGDSYKTGDWITMTGSVILYAQWTRNSSHGGDDDDKYFFAIQKVDAQDGHALNGAKFELYQLDKNDRIVNRRVVETTRQSSKSGIALFSVDNKKSYDGIWYYAEVSAPEGYVLDRTEYEINHKDFSDSLSTAVKYADTVRNYRGTTPDLLNDSDHFAYVIGYMDGNVRPYGLISRAETTTIFFRLLKDSVRDGNLLTSNTYTDVADDYWANTAISTMTGLGIVQGRSTTTFDPKAPITRAQFAAICARFDTGKSNGEQTFSDISGHWAEKYIQRAAELGWIKGFEDGTFRPDTYITRAQAMTMINRVLNRIPEDPSDLLPGMNVWPDCSPGDWFYLAIQEATNSHDYRHKAGSYETWTGLNAAPDWTRYEN